jgi:hypothetical protein
VLRESSRIDRGALVEEANIRVVRIFPSRSYGADRICVIH